MSGLKFLRGIFAVVAGLILMAGAPARAATGDEFWDSRFPLPGISGSDVSAVYAVLADGTNIFVAGHFMDIFSLQVVNVARWDGTEWSALGNGLGGNESFVYSLAKIGTNLYAGGVFGGSGGVIINNLARWDGLAWSPVGGATDGAVFALAVKNGELFAGGSFRHINGVAADGVARWNGTAWSSLANAVTNGVSHSVFAIAFQGNDVIVGGNFSAAGGVPASQLARWDGANWSEVGGGVTGLGGSTVRALAVDGADVYVGGNFTSVSNSINASGIARFRSGGGWSTFGGGILGLNQEVRGVGLIGSDLYVAGSFDNTGTTSAANIARWDGNAWNPVGSGVNDAVHALAIQGEDVFVGGVFAEAGGKDSARFGIFSNPARLHVACTVPTTQLTWRVSVINYVLQSNTNVANAGGWIDLGTAPVVVGTNNVVTDVMDVPQKFYRLFRP